MNKFVEAYIEAAFWASPEVDCGNFNELGVNDFADGVMSAIEADCTAFQRDNAAYLFLAGTDAQNGHDFFLTRNRHGAGFWDRGYHKDIAMRLTEAAHKYGERNLLLGDDGKVYYE